MSMSQSEQATRPDGVIVATKTLMEIDRQMRKNFEMISILLAALSFGNCSNWNEVLNGVHSTEIVGLECLRLVGGRDRVFERGEGGHPDGWHMSQTMSFNTLWMTCLRLSCSSVAGGEYVISTFIPLLRWQSPNNQFQ